MPIYDYKCTKCNHVFDVLQSKLVNTEKCEKCGAKAKRVAANRVGFVFKGSGFYVNDYKKSGAEKTASPAVADKNQTKTPAETKGSGEKPVAPATANAAAPAAAAAPAPKAEKKIKKD